VGVGIIFAGAVVPVLIGWGMRCEPFQPGLIVVMETTFVKIDQIYTKNACLFRLRLKWFGVDVFYIRGVLEQINIRRRRKVKLLKKRYPIRKGEKIATLDFMKYWFCMKSIGTLFGLGSYL